MDNGIGGYIATGSPAGGYENVDPESGLPVDPAITPGPEGAGTISIGGSALNPAGVISIGGGSTGTIAPISGAPAELQLAQAASPSAAGISPSQIPDTQAPSAPSSMQMPTPKAPAQSMPCGQQCWNTYKKYLGWGCGVAGGASAAGSCALACSPLLFGGPQAYGACLARCGIMGGGAIAACAAATTLWYRQCESACNGK